MVRTFLQVAAGAADIPVTRLLGQSPAGLSATGDSDTRNYYDMIAARQELDLRPPLERLDAVVLRAAGVDPEGLRFSFRPLWQLSATEKAAVSLSRAQATAVYAGLQLWPTAVTAALARSQLVEDGTYPGAAAAFAAEAVDGLEAGASPLVTDEYNENQPRDDRGRWTSGGGSGSPALASPAAGTVTASPSSEARVAASSPVAIKGHTAGGTASASGGLGALLAALNPISSASAQEVEPEPRKNGLGNTAEISRPLMPNIIMAQASGGPLLPGGTTKELLEGSDPLDPSGLNTVAPSGAEQLALVATLNLIQQGMTSGLNPHTYDNRPDPKTGATLPISTGGYVTYDVITGGVGRGAKRVVIDAPAKKIFYTNNHYKSFFPIVITKTP